MAETVGFIGLGNMGAAIAPNLIKAGYSVRVYNRTAEKAKPLVEGGATLASKPVDVAQPGGIVVTMVADDHALEELCLPAGSFVERLGSNGIHVSLSTISPVTARKLAEHHAKFNVGYVASPVFGRPEAAAAKRLWICTSGPAAARERVKPIQEAIGQGRFDFGDEVGAANVVKLCGNFLVAASIEMLAEMLTLAEKSGVSKKAVADMISKLSPLHAGYANQIADERFEPAGFRLTLGLKDINLIAAAAAASATPMPLASLLHDRWVSALAKGRGELDWSAIALNVAEDAGLNNEGIRESSAREGSKHEGVRSAVPSAD